MHGRCIYELPRGFVDKLLEYVNGRPGVIQVVSHGVIIFNLAKIISQKEPYVIIRLIGVIQS